MEIKNHRLYVDGERVVYRATPNRGGALVPRGVVLHDTAGRMEPGSSVNWLTSRQAKASAHLVVERDGTAVQLAPFNVQTWHAGRSEYRGERNCNRFTVGIEIVNPGKLDLQKKAWFGVGFPDAVRRSTPQHGDGFWVDYTPEQIATVLDTCLALRQKYGIEFVTAHWFISPGRKVDTNPLFPLQHIAARVAGRETVPESEDWDATTTVHLNQRRWPSVESHVIQVLAPETKLDIVRSGVFDGARWYLVRGAGEEGWVHGAYLDFNQ